MLEEPVGDFLLELNKFSVDGGDLSAEFGDHDRAKGLGWQGVVLGVGGIDGFLRDPSAVVAATVVQPGLQPCPTDPAQCIRSSIRR